MHSNPLQIDEIITNVLSFVGEPDLSGDDAASPQRDLAAMARVCHSICEPALDVFNGRTSAACSLYCDAYPATSSPIIHPPPDTPVELL